jgi:hypothetical protein
MSTPITEQKLRTQLRRVWNSALPFTTLVATYPLLKHGTVWYLDLKLGNLDLNINYLRLEQAPPPQLLAILANLKSATQVLGSNQILNLLYLDRRLDNLQLQITQQLLQLDLPNTKLGFGVRAKVTLV